MHEIEYRCRSVKETVAVGEALGRILRPGDNVFLYGDLGAGKTTFIKGIARALDIDEDEITSASFVIIAEHYGRYPLYHVDLYRIAGEAEVFEIGLEEYLDGDGIAVVEWAERLKGWDSTFSVYLHVRGEEERLIKITGSSERLQGLKNG